MPDSGAVETFLGRTCWADAHRTPLAGDASRRRYERLHLGSGKTAILMIAPPETGEDVRPFARLARHLRALGFSAPEIYEADPDAGFLLTEDLGDALFARLASQDPQCEAPIYTAAVDVLAALHKASPPDDLAHMTPESLAEATALSSIWYAGFGAGDADPAVLDTLVAAFSGLGALDTVLVLRDFHAENLIWLEDRQGTARVGLLDFQDALIGHPAYDLASLLWDARRDLAPGLAGTMLDHYARTTGMDRGALSHAAALFSAQRNLRILGIFARLSLAAGKPGYIDFIPRVWGHLTDALGHPGLEDLRAAVLARHPAPNPGHLTRLAPG